MKIKAIVEILIMVLLVSAFSMRSCVMPAPATTPNLYVDPQTSKAAVGTTFSVNINIANVTDLYCYGLKLNWSGPILNATTITEGPFLKQGGNTFFTPKWFNEPDFAGFTDYLLIVNTLVAEPFGVNGSGTLATVTFLVEEEGESTLHLFKTGLINASKDPIDHKVEDGYVYTSPSIVATVDVNPDTLNLESSGKRISCYIELEEGYDVNEIDVSTVKLIPYYGEILAELKPAEIGDYDSDGVPDLMIKFDRAAVIECIKAKGIIDGEVTLSVTGNLFDGITFSGTYTIRTKSAPPPPIPRVPTIYIDPNTNTASLGETFTINIMIAGINPDQGVYGWELMIKFDFSLLSTEKEWITEGPFLKSVGPTFFGETSKPDYSAWLIGCALMVPVSTSGSGTLATIQFEVVGTGESVLELKDTRLVDINLIEIEHTVADGYFSTP